MGSWPKWMRWPRYQRGVEGGLPHLPQPARCGGDPSQVHCLRDLSWVFQERARNGLALPWPTAVTPSS